MTEVFDIAIVGGGIAGASTAYALGARRSVLLIEREAAWGYHSTGRSAAEFTLRFHASGAGRLTRASKDFLFAQPDGFADVDLLRPRGNLLIAEAGKSDLLRQTYETEAAHCPEGGHKLHLLSVDDALEKVPFLDPAWVRVAFYDEDCWDIEVENLLQGFLRGARRNGVQMQQNASLQSVRRERDHWILETQAGSFRAGIVVNAAGGWADEIAGLMGADPLGLAPMRRTAISVKTPGVDLAGVPEVNEVEEDFYFKPDAGQLMVSPADETLVDPHDAWPEEIDIAYAAHYLTECTTLDVTHVAHSWAGLRTFSADRHPVIGPSSRVPGLFWLAGLGGFGIQTSPAVGQMAAAMLTGETMPATCRAAGIAQDSFSPQRFEG